MSRDFYRRMNWAGILAFAVGLLGLFLLAGTSYLDYYPLGGPGHVEWKYLTAGAFVFVGLSLAVFMPMLELNSSTDGRKRPRRRKQ